MPKSKTRKTKHPKQHQVKSPLPKIKANEYPFINPIIISKDKGVIDGQHRYQACMNLGCKIKSVTLNFASNELKKPECISQLRNIQNQQKIELENYFAKSNIDYKTQIDVCSSVDKIEKFFQFKDKLITDKAYWTCFGKCYTLSTNNYKYASLLLDEFSSARPGKEFMMNDDERNFIKSLPDFITIYRGMSIRENQSSDFGFSWSLNESIAQKFATEYIHNYDTITEEHMVKEILIKKSDIIAYFSSRDEAEIIYIDNKGRAEIQTQL